jgi:hypothetical protein
VTADEVRAVMGWQQRHPALQVRCPHCNASPGARCTSPSGKRPAKEPHQARLDVLDPPPPKLRLVPPSC